MRCAVLGNNVFAFEFADDTALKRPSDTTSSVDSSTLDSVIGEREGERIVRVGKADVK